MVDILPRIAGTGDRFIQGLESGWKRKQELADQIALERAKQEAKEGGDISLFHEIKKYQEQQKNRKAQEYNNLKGDQPQGNLHGNDLSYSLEEQAPQLQNALDKGQHEDSSADDDMEIAQIMRAMGKHELGQHFEKSAEMSQKQEKENTRRKEYGHTSTKDYFSGLEKEGAEADQIKFAIQTVRNAIRSGKTGATAANLGHAYLSSVQSPLAGLFQTKEAGQFNVGMKTLAGGFKKIMGSKPTEREFFWYESILPGLLKKAETNEAILDYFEKTADISLKALEVADRITEENGGLRPADLGSRVRKEMKPYFDDIINEGFKLAGEFEGDSTKGKSSNKTIYTSMPAANSSNRGKTLTDHETGKRYISNGKEWEPLNG